MISIVKSSRVGLKFASAISVAAWAMTMPTPLCGLLVGSLSIVPLTWALEDLLAPGLNRNSLS